MTAARPAVAEPTSTTSAAPAIRYRARAPLPAARHAIAGDEHGEDGDQPDDGGQAHEAVARAAQQGLDRHGAEERAHEPVAATGRGDHQRRRDRRHRECDGDGVPTDADDGGDPAEPRQRPPPAAGPGQRHDRADEPAPQGVGGPETGRLGGGEGGGDGRHRGDRPHHLGRLGAKHGHDRVGRTARGGRATATVAAGPATEEVGERVVERIAVVLRRVRVVRVGHADEGSWRAG